jgi:hypothetical protein
MMVKSISICSRTPGWRILTAQGTRLNSTVGGSAALLLSSLMAICFCFNVAQ